jgi:plasmid stabilization system protein ParE
MRLIWKRTAAKQVNDTLPRMGKRASNPHHEEMRVINVRSYHVFYAVESDSIWILEVKHVRQDTNPQTIRDAPLPTPPAVPSLTL